MNLPTFFAISISQYPFDIYAAPSNNLLFKTEKLRYGSDTAFVAGKTKISFINLKTYTSFSISIFL